MQMEPQSLLFDALIPSLEEVGARFERGDFFVPEMLIAGRAMAGAMEVLRPLLAETGVETVGKFLMGTVKGDVHDIGKNLVNIMLEGAGFEVIDLGVQVAPETFVAKIEEHQPDIVGFSAFLTTTMPMFKANINALQKAGMRDDVIVMVGGAPVTQEYADAVGADGYAADASGVRAQGQGPAQDQAREGASPDGRQTGPAAGDPDPVGLAGGRDRRHAPLLHHRRADQPDRSPHLPGAAQGRRPVGHRARRQGAGRGRRRRARRQHGRPAGRRGRAAGQGRHDDPGADRPAAVHRQLGRRGARGRAWRRTRGARWSTRSPPRTSGWSRSSRWSRSTTPR